MFAHLVSLELAGSAGKRQIASPWVSFLPPTPKSITSLVFTQWPFRSLIHPHSGKRPPIKTFTKLHLREVVANWQELYIFSDLAQ